MLSKKAKAFRERLERNRQKNRGEESTPEPVIDGTEPEIDATDAAARLAEEHGIDLQDVRGTGAGGRIIAADINALI